MNPNQEQWLGLLRDFFKLLGGAMVTNGLVTQADWTTYTGFVVMVAPIAWSMYDKTKSRMIAKVDAMPEVAGVVTKNTADGTAIATASPSPTIVTAGTAAAATLAAR